MISNEAHPYAHPPSNNAACLTISTIISYDDHISTPNRYDLNLWTLTFLVHTTSLSLISSSSSIKSYKFRGVRLGVGTLYSARDLKSKVRFPPPN